MALINELTAELKSHANPEKAKIMQRFFRTGKGEYGEGDKFSGITVPDQRHIARKYTRLSLNNLQKLLLSPLHELRLTSLFILRLKYRGSGDIGKKDIVKFYLKNSKNINNWDLVDSSASSILGDYLLDKPKDVLFKLAKSKNIWERRIAVVSTYTFIRNRNFTTTLMLAKLLLTDKHDLIHKAVGWMLKETGNRDMKVLEKFLNQYCLQMPRTTLRYAIEKMPEKKRREYLQKK
ncbi:MAG TPA: DNA alkylation repair protein [Ignavibacteria bacterium]